MEASYPTSRFFKRARLAVAAATVLMLSITGATTASAAELTDPVIANVTVTPALGGDFAFPGDPVWVDFSGSVGPSVRAGDTSILTIPEPLRFQEPGLEPFELKTSDGVKIADVAVNSEGTGLVFTFTDYGQTHPSTDFSGRFPMLAGVGGAGGTAPGNYALVFSNAGADLPAPLEIRAPFVPSDPRWYVGVQFTRSDHGTLETSQALRSRIISPNVPWTDSTVRFRPSGNHLFDCTTVQVWEYDQGISLTWENMDQELRPLPDASVYEILDACDPESGIQFQFTPTAGVRYVVTALSNANDRDQSLQFRTTQSSRTVWADDSVTSWTTSNAVSRTLGGSGGGAGEVEGPSLRVEALVEQGADFVPLPDSAPGAPLTPGDYRVYYRITNNGNVGLENLTVDDLVNAGNGVVNVDCALAGLTLAPGDVLVCTGDLTVTTEEINYQTVFSVDGESVLTGAPAETEVEWFAYASFADVQIAATANIPTGTTVFPGDEITYTVHARNVGTIAGFGGWFNHLGDVLDDADVTKQPAVATDGAGGFLLVDPDGLPLTDENGDPIETIGDASTALLLAEFDLEAGQEATLTYTVTVKAQGEYGDAHIGNNVRLHYSPIGTVPASWMNGCSADDSALTDCVTFVHHVSDHPVDDPDPTDPGTTDPGASDPNGRNGLATTGGELAVWLGASALVTLLLGGALLTATRIAKRRVTQ